MARFVLTAELSLQAPRNVAQVVQQIQSQLNGVQVNVQVQGARQAQRDVDQLTRSADRANDSFFRMGRTFTASIRRFSALAIATRAVSLLTNTLSSAIEEAISFQQEVVRLSQVTGDSISKLSKLTDEITTLATTLGVSSDKLLSVTTILAQAGLSAEDTRIALTALAKTELAPTFGNITETAEGAVAILAQFKLGAGALEAQLGSLNAVSGKFAVESGDLVEAIRRTGGVFKAAGGDLNELIALFTSVRATTRESAATIATGLRTIFTRIQRPATIAYLKQFGVELTDLEGKFVGPYEAIKQLSEALSGLEEGDISFVQIAEELGGFRQIGKVIPLLREFAISQQALKVAQEGAGSLAKDQATAQLALAVQITKVKEEFFALIRGFTETSTFRVMADVILNLASTFIRLAESVQPILPLLTAFAGIRLAQGIGGLIGGLVGRARGMSRGGKVLAFAKGGLVPGSGSGTADDIPAMVSSGEFVMKKSAVQRIGADTLTAMNENRFATGGIIALNPYDKGSPDTAIRKSGEIKVADVAERAGIPTAKGYRERFTQAASMSPNKELALLAKSGKLNVDAIGLSIGDENVASETESQIKDSFAKLINNSSGALASKFNVAKPSKQITTQDLELFGINGVIGNAFEAMLTTLGAPFDAPPQDEMQKAVNKANNNSAFDYPSGIRSLGKGNLSALADIPTDAKRTVTGKEVNEIITKKYPNLLADAAKQAMSSIKGQELSSLQSKEGGYRTEDLKAYGIRSAKDLEALGWTSPFRGKWNPPVNQNLGGIIQKFAMGGRAKGIQDAPLVDDILQASGSILPRPSAAIQALINAGGGAVDVDRTLKRTIGDTAYAKAPTPEAKNASLDTYFRDEAKRLQDLKTAPITQFGKELQAAIKSGQLNARKVSIISKSKRVKGAAEYLSSQFGIPVQNMIFTQGGSKQPAMDAIRTKGSRIERVNKLYGGIIQKFAQGGTPSPLDSLQEYYADAAPMNLGLAESKNLTKEQRQKLASNVRNLRNLRTPAPSTLYSSISRIAFNKMANQIGFNKDPEMPAGTKYNDIEKILDKEAKQTIGKAFNLPGFVSTSKDYAKAKTFLDNAPRSEDNWAAMLTIATKANAQGVDVEKQLSGRQLNITKQDINPRTGKMETMYMKPPSSEEEVILQPRSRFKITQAKAVKLGANKNLWATAQQFATGGVVPGVGNRDTVPAMLNEGDFVIRKSSTKNIGTDVLSSMAGYAAGGSVSKGVPALLTPGEFVFSKEEAQGVGYGKLNRMNKVGKYAKGGTVGAFKRFTNPSFFRFGGKAAEKNISDSFNREGYALVSSMTEVGSILKNFIGGLTTLPDSVKSVVSEIKTFTLSKDQQFKTNAGDRRGDQLRGISMGGKVGINTETAGTHTVKHEAAHEVDRAMGSGGKLASRTEGTFQNKIASELRKTMEKEVGTSEYRLDLAELFADALAKVPPEVQKILVSTTDAAKGSKLLAEYFERAGGPVAGLADLSADEFGGQQNKASPSSGSSKKPPIDVDKFTLGPEDWEDPKPIGPSVTPPSPPIPPAGFRPMGSPGSIPPIGPTITPPTPPPSPPVPPSGFRPMGSPGSLPSMSPTVTPPTSGGPQQKAVVDKGITGLGKMTEGLFATQIALSYLTPTVDENSSAITKMTASFTSGITTVLSTVMALNGALQLFNINLNVESLKKFATGQSSMTDVFSNISNMKGVKGAGKQLKAGYNRGLTGGRVSVDPTTGVVKEFAERRATTLAGKVGQSAGQFAKSNIGSKVVSAGKSISSVATRGAASVASVIPAKLSANFAKVATGLNAMAGPLLLVEVGLMAASSMINSFFDYQNQANKAIQEGNVEKAKENSVSLAAQESIDSFGSAAVLTGAALGSVFPVVGTLAGAIIGAGVAITAKFVPGLEKALFGTDYFAQAFIGLGTVFGGQTYDSIVAVAEAAALESKSKKALIEMEKQATQAMKEFTDGNISAYEALQRTADTTQTVADESVATAKANKAREGDKSDGFARGALRIGTLGIAGLLGVESGAQRNKKIDEENKGRTEANVKRQEQAIETSQPMTDALARATAASGGDLDSFKENLERANPGLFQLYSTLDPTGKRMAELERRFGNLQAEAEKTRKAFQAINLGFQGVDATASALTVGLENYLATQQAGNVGLVQSISTLQAGITNAAQGISTEEFQSALTDAEVALTAMGATGEGVDKFKENMTAINTAQKFYASATEDAKKSLQEQLQRGASGSATPKSRQQALSDALTSQLEGAGVSEKVRKRIGDAIAGAEIKDTDLEAILNGNFEVLDKVLKDLGEKTFGQVNKSLEQYAKYQQQLVKLTQERIKIEGQLRDAQKSTIDATLEAAKIAQEFGGAAVTPDQNRQAIIAKANVDSQDLGVGELKTGSAKEIKARQAMIKTALTDMQTTKVNAADGKNKGAQKALQGKEGAQLSANSERLQKLAQENYNTTKALIDQKREEIKLIQAKNQLEKASMDALIDGDIMKFFDSQAAMGAQAALATGDQQLISQFDTASLGAATKDLERQKEAGVTQRFGRDIGGSGGLIEGGYSAIGGRVGLSQTSIEAAAQTTPEQLQAEKEARELAGTLPENMSILEMSAQTDLDAANKQLEAAEKQLEAARGEVNKSAAGPVKPAAGLARGGTVYASRGTFVNFKPKGTDTVPAMLTPGEFVVNRQSVQRGNNLAILTAMNKGQSAPAATGMSRGGSVKYMDRGGITPKSMDSGVSINIDVKALQAFSASLSQFNDALATNIQTLKDTKFQVSLSPTNINVNLTGTSFLEMLTSSLKSELLSYVGKVISQYTIGTDGKLKKSGSNLGTGL